MKKILVILTIFISILVSCKKDSGFGLEIYLLDDFKTPLNSLEIIAGSEKLSKTPIIYYHNIIYYDSTDYFFKLDLSKAEELKHMDWTYRKAFSLTIDKTIIYSGYFDTYSSNAGVDWIVINPLSIDSSVDIKLGYPVVPNRLRSNDPRNDGRLIDLLKKDNKLR
jgi:hypothetical protein